MNRRRNMARRIVLIAASAVVGVALVAGAILAYLSSTAGERLLRRQLLERVNSEIRGRLALGRLSIERSGVVILRDLELFDPEGLRIGRIARVETTAHLHELVEKRVHIDPLRIEGVEILLTGSAEGMNLTRALAARKPSPPQAPASSSLDWTLRVDDLAVSELHMEARPKVGEPPSMDLRAAGMEGSARYGPGEARIALRATGALAAPLPGPFAVDVAAHGGSPKSPHDPLTVERVLVSAGASRARLSGAFRDGSLTAHIEELALARTDLAAIFPKSPIASNLTATGTATLGADGATASLRIPVRDGKMDVEANVAFSPLVASATLIVDKVDLARVLESAPATELSGTLRGSFARGEPAPGMGELSMQLAPSVVRGVRIEKATANVQIRGMEATPSLVAFLPGGRITVGGVATTRRVNLRALLALPSIEAFSSAAARLAGAGPPMVAGRGTLTAHLVGDPHAPRLTLSGALDELATGAFRVEGMKLDAELPNATRPHLFKATVVAAKGAVSDLPFANLEAEIVANRRTFTADLHATGLAGLKTHLAGELAPDQSGGRISELVLATEEARWTLARPAMFDLHRGVRVDQLTLQSGSQQMEIRGGIERSRLDVSTQATRLDLAKLPALLVPKRLALAGIATLDARIRGTTSHPEGRASLAIGGLRVLGWNDVDAQGDLTLTGTRALGTLVVRRHGATVQASGDVAFKLLDAPAGTPLSLRLDSSPVSLADVGAALERPELTQGTASFHAELSGTADRPRLRWSLELRDATWGRYPALTVVASGELAESAAAQAAFDTQGGRVELDATGAVSLRALLHERTLAALRDVRFQAALKAPNLELAGFAGTLLPENTMGIASITANVTGPATRLRGEAGVTIKDAAIGRWHGLAIASTLVAGDDHIALAADATVASQPLAHVTAQLTSPWERLQTVENLAAAGISAAIESGPFELASLLSSEESPVKGTMTGRASLSGTLGDPAIEVRAAGADLAIGDAPLARAEASGQYRRGVVSAVAHLDALHGAGATARATLHSDWGLRALLGGVPWAGARMDARLNAKNLDLRALNGLSPALHHMSGVLSGEATATGTLGAPIPRGHATVQGGRITLPGYGTFRDVSFDLSITDRAIDLARLTAKAGRGMISLSAKGSRTRSGGPYQLAAQASVSNVPLFVNDQLVAYVSGETASCTGSVDDLDTRMDLRLSRLVLDLPETTNKDLQSLDENPHIQVRTGRDADAAPGAKKAAEPGRGFRLELHVQAPGNLWAQSTDAKIEAGADLRVTTGRGETKVAGNIETKSGRVEVIGRRFDLTRGHVTWGSSDAPANPRLDVSALYENQREQVKVRVDVSGTAKQPRIDLTSEPPLDEAQIATLLATGRRDLKRGSGGVASGGAATALTSVVADKLRKSIAATLPLDVLQVEVGEQGLPSTRLEAGTYVTDKIYVGYRRNFGADLERGENANEVRVEYQLTPKMSVETEYGDAGRGGADVVYTRDY